jgi:hypothetical protein
MKKLKVSTEVYSIANIEKTVLAYKGIARITVRKATGYLLINFLKCKYDEDRTVKEFENYLIGLENS